ncbi:class I SAM-dependent methyltransferase [Roseospira marina]|uniref:Ubiquinone/menaquinone biosynthesis C-methyltransferase UbiE n=1 Tax=Roseospira marina TaxID=140057 RepID=A0A5M6IHW6_9PROT|nr:class I SAM-dependent methyltransferase [Roseospira marina]KAA5607235.1 class I SAM-dependent methyltransferase [Roseospira marina]MBB4312613.1 demethylmenaquinone methyltransferase/2-methoxy-6-polyprenyl-1,4-benzoquinol methylase [Roseospira marina]MBB5085371.1 demethylmenaquinone methyltransferase/2-methoxy-6-polyprenyl-1,4-benzoquinol methylase [Roseospira marina]
MTQHRSAFPESGASATAADPDTTHFGYRTVRAAEKAGMVRGVFDSVASRYDLMNDLMSGGVHRLWKDSFVAQVAPRPGMVCLDVGGGTGDIAFRLMDQMTKRAEARARQRARMSGADADGDTAPITVPSAGGGRVMVCDINANMISVGRDRALDRGMVDGLDWMVGDAEKLPIEDDSVDVYTIAFCLRNVTRIDAALAEARRVLKPGGRFFCLEFSKVVLPGFDKLYDAYSFSVLPTLGQFVAGDRESYEYLAESIRRFPSQRELCQRMSAAGLQRARHRNLSAGIAAVHSGVRL